MPDTLCASRGDVTFVVVGSSSQTSVASGLEALHSSPASGPPEGCGPGLGGAAFSVDAMLTW